MKRFIFKIWYLLELFAFYLWELTVSNVQLAIETFRPTIRLRPSFLALPLDVESDDEILAFSNLLTFTPGAVSMDISDDKKTLYAHVIFSEDAEKVRQRIKYSIERRVKRLFGRASL